MHGLKWVQRKSNESRGIECEPRDNMELYSILYRCKKSQHDQDELNGEINSAWASNQMVFDKSLGMCVAHW